MSPPAVTPATAHRIDRIRVIGALALGVLAALVMLQPPGGALQAAWFDACQRWAPRRIESMPVVVVAVDEQSLAAVGRWPWPRTLLAQLVDEIAAHRPAAIGVDILMPEADPLSPHLWTDRVRRTDPALAARLAALPSNDAELARSLAAARTVLAVAGMPEPTGRPLRAPPFALALGSRPSASIVPTVPTIARFEGVLGSVEELDRAATGHGLVSVDATERVIRRVPLVASIGGTLVPALAIEMLRVAAGVPSLRLLVSGTAVEGIAIGEYFVPTERDGAARIRYSARDARRFVSASAVLERSIEQASLRDKLVLVAVTALGLGEYHHTPLGERMPGSEVHAQLVENLFDGSLLQRPAWAQALEAGVLAVLGALLVWATPRWRPRDAALLALASVAFVAGAAFALFEWRALVFDAATPGLGLLVLFGGLLVLTLGEATRQRERLAREVQEQREQRARLAGELEAARRIQTGMLPSAEALCADCRIDLAAAMTPAREVGGDLYDFFRLDERRLFFLVGDVAGKGLSASIFMVVSKALCKSAMLRAADAEIGTVMSAANVELARDNPEMLFVTAFAAILDLETGELAYCNAGHENPYVLSAAAPDVHRIEEGGGPPLCVVDDFAYEASRHRMRPGDRLCLISDGVTEAHNPAGELYGSARVQQALLDVRADAFTAREVVSALYRDVDAFAAGAEPADDATVLVLRWNGPVSAR